MKPNKNHANKNLHNWLIYRISDKFIELNKQYYKGTLVDLGCGESPYESYFLQYSDKYIGVDWENTSHNSKATILSDLNNSINLDNNSADTIVSFSVMEHLYNPQQFLNESFRILKKDSHIILQVPWQWHIHEAPHDYFRYTPFGLEYMLKKSGFKEIKISAQSGYFTTACLKFNYFLVRLIYKLPKIIMYPLAFLCLPIWTLGQLLAPLLDKLDKEWNREAVGFIVIAKK